jgi:hypothetical protein
MFPYKWKSCPYCDPDGLQLIEAAESSIIEYLNQLSDEGRERLIKTMK